MAVPLGLAELGGRVRRVALVLAGNAEGAGAREVVVARQRSRADLEAEGARAASLAAVGHGDAVVLAGDRVERHPRAVRAVEGAADGLERREARAGVHRHGAPAARGREPDRDAAARGRPVNVPDRLPPMVGLAGLPRGLPDGAGDARVAEGGGRLERVVGGRGSGGSRGDGRERPCGHREGAQRLAAHCNGSLWLWRRRRRRHRGHGYPWRRRAASTPHRGEPRHPTGRPRGRRPPGSGSDRLRTEVERTPRASDAREPGTRRDDRPARPQEFAMPVVVEVEERERGAGRGFRARA